VLISRSVELTSAVSPVGRAFWILLMFLAWGAALGWSYRRTVHDASTGPLGVGALDSTGRRRFMIRLSGAAAIVSLIGGALGRVARNRGEARLASEEPWSARNQLPNVNVPVKPVLGTRPEFTPFGQHYRIDINATPPVIEEAAWRLRITGLIGKPLVWTIDDIRARAPMHQFITLSCISNNIGGDLIGTTRWTGVSLKQLLPELGLLRNATHLKIRSVDSFYEVVALDRIRADDRVMLTYAWDGVPLSAEHGFPLRIYIPDCYGMKQPKWIESIEAIDHWEPGFWVVRGWDSEARMKATSAIDTIATNMTIGQPNSQMRVPIGGFAHAGVRGVSRVEIRVDSGPWKRAELRPPLSGQTWVLWRYDWPLQKGKHTFTVRCFEEDGTPQIQQEAPPDPSGASGLYRRSAMF
jgi:DMSO/TMAO reductase YedYZ molybdopterin-dependent catalytic subunit